MDPSKFSIAFEHNGEAIAVSIETVITSATVQVEGAPTGVVRYVYDKAEVEGVFARLTEAAKWAMR
jgi:hypothetical protein